MKSAGSEVAGHAPVVRKPSWLRTRLPRGATYTAVRRRLAENHLHTVCESAQCPNLGECWSRGTATFLILGEVCTRHCGFCAVRSGRPSPVDDGEPSHLARIVTAMKLNYVVVTSVTRDDLADGGASAWAADIRAVRAAKPGCRIEALVPDFDGRPDSLETVLAARPDVLAHNLETVAGLYPRVRPQADYGRSLQLLRRAKDRGCTTKSGLMLGLGESEPDLEKALADLCRAGVNILTLGQYLQPTPDHLPVIRYVPPEEFEAWRKRGLEMGFQTVVAGPLVRSSYHAEQQFKGAL